MAVDEPRQQHLVVVEVDHLGCGEVGVERLDGDDLPLGHADPAGHLPGRGHHTRRAEHQVQLGHRTPSPGEVGVVSPAGRIGSRPFAIR